MNLRDEFNRLVKLFHEGAEGKQPVNLEEIFRSSLEFFEHLKAQIQTGTPDEKKEALMMMAELYNQMTAETKHITERSGLSEEQLVSFAENPGNFSPEQWRSIQESRDRITKAGQDLAKVIQMLAQVAPPAPKEQKEKKHPPKKSKKSEWLRS